MKKILIFTGLSTLLLLMAVWGYLLFFGTPESVKEAFTDLGFNDATPIDNAGEANAKTQLALPNTRLVQLSTKAVAGFTHIASQNSSSSASTDAGRLRYAERGTGHVYEIELNEGVENRVSGNTIGKVIDAVFSADGNSVVLVKETENDDTEASWYVFGATSEKSESLPEGSDHFAFTKGGKLHFSITTQGETTGYEQDDLNQPATELWSIPMTDVDIAWLASSTLVTNKTAPELKGGIYRIENGHLVRLIAPQYALSSVIAKNGQRILYSFYDIDLKAKISNILETETEVTTPITLPAIPEKCTLLLEKFVCASSAVFQTPDRYALTAWYRGEFTSSDTFWMQGSKPGTAEHMDYLKKLSGFDIDVTDLVASEDGKTLFFRNKINDTLWMYKVGE